MSKPTKNYYKVSFDFEDDSRNANSQDFRDLLMEMFQQAVMEGRMTNVEVGLDHARIEAVEGQKPKEAEGQEECCSRYAKRPL
jgi:hypothetical protein